MWKIKNGFCFCKNCLTLFVSGREKNALCRAHYLVWPKNFLAPKECKPGKTIKIVVSAEIAQNQKWHLFWKKGFFDMVEKVGFTNCVFEKLCFSENIIFIVFSAKHSFLKKTVCWQKTENLWKIVGCFWTWKMVFFGFVFFRLYWFVFCVSAIVAKVLKMIFFPVLGAFVGWFIVVYLGWKV